MKRLKKPFLILSTAILSVTIILLIFTAMTYQKIFGRRFEADENPLALSVADFPDLLATPVAFLSGPDTLRGNFYTSSMATQEQDALIIFCHGFSNGSRDYLAQIDFFARSGFEVLAYDNTGCHQSTGKSVKGIPQAVINLRDVLKTITTDPGFTQYHRKPLVLMGHSWGGYAVNAVLNDFHSETIKAVVSFSAPNQSVPMLVEQGHHLFGDFIYLLKPLIHIVEFSKFGMYSADTAIGGVNRTSAQVLALHSRDDPVVSYQSSLAFQEPLAKNPHFEIVLMEQSGHKTALSEEAKGYAAQLESLAKTLSVPELEAQLREADRMQLYQLDDAVLESVRAFVLNALAA